MCGLPKHCLVEEWYEKITVRVGSACEQRQLEVLGADQWPSVVLIGIGVGNSKDRDTIRLRAVETKRVYSGQVCNQVASFMA